MVDVRTLFGLSERTSKRKRCPFFSLEVRISSDSNGCFKDLFLITAVADVVYAGAEFAPRLYRDTTHLFVRLHAGMRACTVVRPPWAATLTWIEGTFPLTM